MNSKGEINKFFNRIEALFIERRLNLLGNTRQHANDWLAPLVVSEPPKTETAKTDLANVFNIDDYRASKSPTPYTVSESESAPLPSEEEDKVEQIIRISHEIDAIYKETGGIIDIDRDLRGAA